MYTLEQQARRAMKDIEQHRQPGKNSKVPRGATRERTLVMLWGMFCGWSNLLISKQARCSESTARRDLKWIMEHPHSILEYGLLEKRRKMWKCNVCRSDLTNTSEKRAREHVLLHFFTREYLALNPDWMIIE